MVAGSGRNRAASNRIGLHPDGLGPVTVGSWRCTPACTGEPRRVKGDARSNGPSPRTRGSRDEAQDHRHDLGSIPAHAGEPTARAEQTVTDRVHPRARGGATGDAPAGVRYRGPSPRTRGSRPTYRCVAVIRGSIPAHAGEPAGSVACAAARGVHPRARGGAMNPQLHLKRDDGPSPRTRGSHSARWLMESIQRSIPAHAGEPPRPRPTAGGHRVHPRARGGAGCSTEWSAYNPGPSPRTRGSRPGRLGRAAVQGSIPAHAGEPSSCSAASDGRRVHPRARGGAARMRGSATTPKGPSPRTRGSRLAHVPQQVVIGSIPAHAGEPPWTWRRAPARRVHPRARGGASPLSCQISPSRGPSPRTRGSLRIEHAGRAAAGSIPAHAGEPPAPPEADPRGGVHPRARGGACSAVPRRRRGRGPSPRTRGSPSTLPRLAVGAGSIPAHAGEPWPSARPSLRAWVHPRARGGAAALARFQGRGLGPSPRTRGSPDKASVITVNEGSIPAHAGEPSKRTRPTRRPAVHPRARGGALRVRILTLVALGPSPRTRGSRYELAALPSSHGSIPAHAGEPMTTSPS